MNNHIQDRLESRIQQAVNTLIVSGEIKNPKLSTFASVCDIKLSRDNAYATLYVSCLDERALNNSVKALQAAAPFIQGRLAKALRTKNTPHLSFVADTVEKEAQHIEELLSSLK